MHALLLSEGSSLAEVGLGARDRLSHSSTGRAAAECRGLTSLGAVQGIVLAPKATLPSATRAVLGGMGCVHLPWCTALLGQCACCCQPVPH